jgi:hypothetical protein
MNQGVQSEIWCDAPQVCEEITTQYLPRRGDIVVHRDHCYRVQDVVHYTQGDGDKAGGVILAPVLRVCNIDPDTCGTPALDSSHD